MKIGYARVSTLEQNLDLQVRALEKAGCKKIFREKVSSVSRERPQFQSMLNEIRTGDTIVVWKLDRLARSTRDLLETMEAIREAAGKFQSLSEPWADTTTHAGKMIMTIGNMDLFRVAVVQAGSVPFQIIVNKLWITSKVRISSTYSRNGEISYEFGQA
jgi:DNA invertase Pin-like site-specific DNA recombinase